MAGWEKHPTGDFHVLPVSRNVRIHRAVADGAITVYMSTFDHDVVMSVSLPIPDEQRSRWIEALTTGPDDESESR